jgi:hypothetical protein
MFFHNIDNVERRIETIQRRIEGLRRDYLSNPEENGNLIDDMLAYSHELIRLQEKYNVFLKLASYDTRPLRESTTVY